MTSLRHRISAAALSAVAVLAAHDIAYRIAISDAHERAHLLEETGHGWWAYVPYLVGAALATATLATATTRHAHRLRWALGPAAAIMYVAIEVLERVIGESHHGVVHLPTLALGSAIALVFGLVAAALLALGERIAVACRSRRPVFAAARPTWTPRLQHIVDWTCSSIHSGRSPPVYSALA